MEEPYPAPVVVPAASAKHSATVIFLHGLGDCAEGWVFLAEAARKLEELNHVKFLFPGAKMRPLSMNYGVPITSWYDIRSLSAIYTQEDEEGILESVEHLCSLVEGEISEGIDPSRIIIGGFSQGCAVSLLTAFTSLQPLAGVMGIAGYFPLKLRAIEAAKQRDQPIPTKIFIGHGENDKVIKTEWSDDTYELILHDLHVPRGNITFRKYAGVAHSVSPEEIDDIIDFIRRTVPQEAP